MITLEKKGLKKAPTKELFETIAKKIERALEEKKTRKKANQDIKCDLKRLQTTYNDLKQKWRKVTDKKSLVLV